MKQSIRSLKAEIQKLRELSSKDGLTGIYNRRGFLEETSKFLAEAMLPEKFREKRKSFVVRNFSLVVFDIDNFKKLNDSYGHQAGDKALVTVANDITNRAREVDVVGRWGGEELVLGLVGANEKDAFGVADAIRRHIEEHEMRWAGKRMQLTVSAGVAVFDGKGDFDKLFAKADKALYAAKHRGKNCVIRYSELKKNK